MKVYVAVYEEWRRFKGSASVLTVPAAIESGGRYAIVPLDNERAVGSQVVVFADAALVETATLLKLADDPSEALSLASRTLLGNRLGENLDEPTVDALLVNLLTVRADGVKRNPIEATKVGDREQRFEIRACGDLLAASATLPTIRGGAVSDSFNRADNTDENVGAPQTITVLGPETFSIISDALSMVRSGSKSWFRIEADVGSNDHECEIAWVNVTGSGDYSESGPTVRGNASNSVAYYFNIYDNLSGSHGSSIYSRNSSGGLSDLGGSLGGEIDRANGQVQKLVVAGSLLSGYQATTKVAEVTDSSITTGQRIGGHHEYVASSRTDRFDYITDNDGGGGGSSVILDGKGTASSAGTASLLRAADLTGTGATSTAGRGDILKAAILAGQGTIASAGSGNALLSANLAGSGNSSNAGIADLLAVMDLSGLGSSSTTGIADLLLAAYLDGHGDISTAGIADLTVTGASGEAVDLAGYGSAATTGVGNLLLAALLDGHGDIATTGTGAINLTLYLEGHGDTATVGTASLTVAASTVATATIIHLGKRRRMAPRSHGIRGAVLSSSETPTPTAALLDEWGLALLDESDDYLLDETG